MGYICLRFTPFLCMEKLELSEAKWFARGSLVLRLGLCSKTLVYLPLPCPACGPLGALRALLQA